MLKTKNMEFPPEMLRKLGKYLRETMVKPKPHKIREAYQFIERFVELNGDRIPKDILTNSWQKRLYNSIVAIGILKEIRLDYNNYCQLA